MVVRERKAAHLYNLLPPKVSVFCLLCSPCVSFLTLLFVWCMQVVKENVCPLSSDAFSRFGEYGSQAHDNEVCTIQR